MLLYSSWCSVMLMLYNCHVTLLLSCCFAFYAPSSLSYYLTIHDARHSRAILPLSCYLPLSFDCSLSSDFVAVMWLLRSYATFHSYTALPLTSYLVIVMMLCHSCCRSATVILSCQSCFLPVSCYPASTMMLATDM